MLGLRKRRQDPKNFLSFYRSYLSPEIKLGRLLQNTCILFNSLLDLLDPPKLARSNYFRDNSTILLKALIERRVCDLDVELRSLGSATAVSENLFDF